MSHKNPSRKHRSRLSTPVRLCVAAVAACFLATPVMSAPPVPATNLPTGFTNLVGIDAKNIVAGANSLNIITSATKSAADVANFNIAAGYSVGITQPTASSDVLFRVLSNNPSVIYGRLSSNGGVYLVNPGGIFVGAGGQVDVARFAASTLPISSDNFLAGRNLFVNDGTAKDVVNQGTITTPAGGSVYLIGSNVTNDGIITTPGGETILAAGNTVSLIDSALPGLKVDITGAEGNATNLGTIAAEAGRIGIAGVIVRNSGTLNASSVVNDGGRIFLKASKDAYVDGNGRIVTTGTKGGQVEVLGNRVAVMDNAEINASGANGGGRILVGGDYQGKNPDVQNASISYFGADASLRADATEVGTGGTVVIWADDTTRAYGSISARGGASGGDGGRVETSGKRVLDTVGIRVNASAVNGQAGSWLLDPNDVQIINGTGADANVTFNGGSWSATNDSAIVYGGNIASALNGGTSVIIQTGSGGTQPGDITMSGVTLAVTPANHTSLRLNAHRSIIIGDSSISSSGNALDLTLNAHFTDNAAPGNVQITNSSINTNGGNVLIGGGIDPATTGAIGYDAALYATRYGVLVENASISTGSGNIRITGQGLSNSTDDADGIDLWDSSAVLQTTSGNITLIGKAGNNATSASSGVYVGGTVQSSGAGAITIDGTGGAGGAGPGVGVKVSGGSVAVSSGNLSITGYGGTSAGGDNSGIWIRGGATVASAATGAITLTGFGGAATDWNQGVLITSAGDVSSQDGNITISGIGAGTGFNNRGIEMSGGAKVRSLGLAGINLTGTGGTGTDYNDGIYLSGTGSAGTAVQSAGGAIVLNGQGAGTGTSNIGIRIRNGATVSAMGSASITLEGSGGGGTAENQGVAIYANTGEADSTLQSSAGAISVTGYGGGSGSLNYGIHVNRAFINTNGGGSVALQAHGSGMAGDIDIATALLNSSGGLNLYADNDIHLGSNTGYGSMVQSSGPMIVSAGHDLNLIGGSGIVFGSQGPGATLQSGGTQTITAGNQILLQAGSADNTVYSGSSMYGGSAVMNAMGDQTITAPTIKLVAGLAGNDNVAAIIGGGATQTINVTTLLDLKGGEVGEGNYAWIGAVGASGVQTIDATGADIVLTGGASGGAQNRENSADIGLGNSNTGGSRTVFADNITINGDGDPTTFGGAGFGTHNGRTQTFNVTGDLTMNGGASSVGDFRATAAYIGSETGGGTINLYVDGDIVLNGGTGVDGGVMIGSLGNSGATTTVNLLAANDITTTGGTGGVWLGVRSPTGAAAGDKVLMIAGWDGSKTAPGTVDMTTGSITSSGNLNTGGVEFTARAADSIALGNLIADGGMGAAGGTVKLTAVNGTLTVDSISARGGAGNAFGAPGGAGGSVTLWSQGLLTVGLGGIDATGGQGGDGGEGGVVGGAGGQGGTVMITSQTDNIAVTGNIFANGGTGGMGGMGVTGTGSGVVFGQGGAGSQGGTGGKGGSIMLEATAGSMVLGNFSVSARGGSGGWGGNGGMGMGYGTVAGGGYGRGGQGGQGGTGGEGGSIKLIANGGGNAIQIGTAYSAYLDASGGQGGHGGNGGTGNGFGWDGGNGFGYGGTGGQGGTGGLGGTVALASGIGNILINNGNLYARGGDGGEGGFGGEGNNCDSSANCASAGDPGLTGVGGLGGHAATLGSISLTSGGYISIVGTLNARGGNAGSIAWTDSGYANAYQASSGLQGKTGGNGGSITLEASGDGILLDSASLRASGGSGGSGGLGGYGYLGGTGGQGGAGGKGGSIMLKATGSTGGIMLRNNADLYAGGGQGGEGGTGGFGYYGGAGGLGGTGGNEGSITLHATGSNGSIVLDGAFLNAAGGSGGRGGYGGYSDNGNLGAGGQGGTGGVGGSILLTANGSAGALSVGTSGAQLSASGGAGGDGGNGGYNYYSGYGYGAAGLGGIGGAGGSVSVQTGSILADGPASFTARGGDRGGQGFGDGYAAMTSGTNGAGGTVELVAAGNISFASLNVDVSGGNDFGSAMAGNDVMGGQGVSGVGGGAGGDVVITSQAGTIIVSGGIVANGGQGGTGGYGGIAIGYSSVAGQGGSGGAGGAGGSITLNANGASGGIALDTTSLAAYGGNGGIGGNGGFAYVGADGGAGGLGGTGGVGGGIMLNAAGNSGSIALGSANFFAGGGNGGRGGVGGGSNYYGYAGAGGRGGAGSDAGSLFLDANGPITISISAMLDASGGAGGDGGDGGYNSYLNQYGRAGQGGIGAGGGFIALGGGSIVVDGSASFAAFGGNRGGAGNGDGYASMPGGTSGAGGYVGLGAVGNVSFASLSIDVSGGNDFSGAMAGNDVNGATGGQGIAGVGGGAGGEVFIGSQSGVVDIAAGNIVASGGQGGMGGYGGVGIGYGVVGGQGGSGGSGGAGGAGGNITVIAPGVSGSILLGSTNLTANGGGGGAGGTGGAGYGYYDYENGVPGTGTGGQGGSGGAGGGEGTILLVANGTGNAIQIGTAQLTANGSSGGQAGMGGNGFDYSGYAGFGTGGRGGTGGSGGGGGTIGLQSPNGGITMSAALTTLGGAWGSGGSAGYGNNPDPALVAGGLAGIDGGGGIGGVIAVYNGADLDLAGAGHIYDAGTGGDISITSGGSLSGIGTASFLGDPASILLTAAGGGLSLYSGGLSKPLSDIGLTASGLMAIDQPVSGLNVTLSGTTTHITGSGSVSATNDSIVSGSSIIIDSGGGRVDGGNVLLRGGNLYLNGEATSNDQLEFSLANLIGGAGGRLLALGPTGNITGIVSGNILLDSGAYLHAANDVNLTLKGENSTLTTSNGGYVLAGIPQTIHLKFDLRTSGGLVNDGSLGSGMFVVVGGNIVQATAGNGLDLDYPSVVIDDPCVTNPASCKPVDPNKTPDTLPPKTDPTKPPEDLSKTTGGTEGTFGGETDGAGGSDLDLLVTSAPTSAGTAEKKDEKKDEKDKKDKKSDEAKDEKRDEKPAAKKVAQCS